MLRGGPSEFPFRKREVIDSPIWGFPLGRAVTPPYNPVWPNPDTGGYDERAIDLAPECVRFFFDRIGTLVKSGKNQVAA